MTVSNHTTSISESSSLVHSSPQPCPRCNGVHIHKRGYVGSKQRYYCYDYGRTWHEGATVLRNYASPPKGRLLLPGMITRREWLRFLDKIALGAVCECTPGKPHRHWMWTAALVRNYGQFKWRAKTVAAYRFAYIA